MRKGEVIDLGRPLVWLKGSQLGLLNLHRVVGKEDKTSKA